MPGELPSVLLKEGRRASVGTMGVDADLLVAALEDKTV